LTRPLRVLAILGSPKRNGNGHAIARRIERELRSLGDVEMTILFLADAGLGLCKGCFGCIRNGEDRCPCGDDRALIEREIDAHDGIILVSPGYVQNVSGLMKNFMDRMAYTHHRPKWFDKRVMVVANGGAGLPLVLDALRKALGGPRVTAELQVLALPWPMQPRTVERNERALRKAVAAFHASLGRGAPASPTFGEYVGFRFFKLTSPGTREWLPADYEWYKDKADYYYPARIGMGKRLGAALVTRLVLFMMKGMAPGTEPRPVREMEAAAERPPS